MEFRTEKVESTMNLVRYRKKNGCILAWHSGKRQDKDFLALGSLLQSFPISVYHTDDWGSYSRYIPAEMHRFGKDNTWRTEKLKFQNTHKAFEPKNRLFLEKRTDT